MKKTTIIISVIAFILIIVGTIYLINPKTINTVTFPKSDKLECEQKNEYVIDFFKNLDSSIFECPIPCQPLTQEVKDCILRNTNDYNLKQNEITESSEINKFYSICWKKSDFMNASDRDFTESRVLYFCYKNPDYDWRACPIEADRCKDGSYVTLDPNNGCIMQECPIVSGKTIVGTIIIIAILASAGFLIISFYKKKNRGKIKWKKI